MDDTDDLPSLAAAKAASNVPEYAVSELSGAIKQTLEGAFGRIRVRGEITELKLYGSGHTYLSLKDEGGKIRAVIWRTTGARLGLKPANGVEVVATGKISAYGDRSEYQLIIDRLEYAGAGALLARVERLKTALAAEGLFDAARKKALPRLPAVIGVITSANGAVLHDILTTIARRFPRPVLLWPVPVQGEGSAERIAEAIAGMDSLPANAIARPDVLIVARGGGSLEDLMAFNDEGVVRAAAACRMPLISAIGHETDTTLIDFVADRRAPTPTAAAELALPSRQDLAADLMQNAARLINALLRISGMSRARLDTAGAHLPDIVGILGHASMRVDDRVRRLSLALPNHLTALSATIHRLAGLIPPPATLIQNRRHPLQLLDYRLLGALQHSVQNTRSTASAVAARLTTAPIDLRLQVQRSSLAVSSARLESASYAGVLARGFALVRKRNGTPVTSAAALQPGSRMTITFGDGQVAATADRAVRPQSELMF